MHREQTLWSKELLLIFGATFLVYANISVFFHFYEYLRTLPIDPGWYGLLISVFSAVPLLVRPVISPLFHTGNAYRFLYIGTVFLMGSLAMYTFAVHFWSMLFVRILHGFSFVLLGTALMTVVVDFIPKERSAQFFGMMSVIVLIPNTIVPPILPFLTGMAGGFTQVLILFALITALVLPLLATTRRSSTSSEKDGRPRRLSRMEIVENLRDPMVSRLLLAMLSLYTGHALVFFFLDGFGRWLGIASTGFFLTLSTAGEIGIRVAGGSLFDRSDKAGLALLVMAAMAPVYILLAYVRSENLFFFAGLLLGLGWGIAMPVFNALLFDVSRPRVRAFNTNLGLQMFQGGFLLGPIIGAPVVARWGFPTLFNICAVLSVVSAALIFSVRTRVRSGAGGAALTEPPRGEAGEG
ncbi:MAG: MFS transporter [Desulfobacteraceae bacterium]|nr:MAG: MFS transporter [Desulfobacteraceae bacterium]